MTRTIHYCNFCDYKSDRRYDRDKHVSRKHANDHSTPSQAGSDAVQSVQPHSHNEKHSNQQEENVDQLYKNILPPEQAKDGNSPPKQMQHSNLQEENIDQLYENINQWKEAYETLKEQYQKLQQEEKVTTCNDGRPSHVSIQLYDKSCNALKAYMDQNQRFQNEKEQLLYKFCTDWEDLKWERDTFAKEIRRRDRCGEGVIHKKLAKKLRSGKYWDRIH